MTEEIITFKVENAVLKYRNFEGKEAQFNPKGNRNFCVVLDEETARNMAADGWNVKFPNPRDEEDDPEPFIQVSVRFDIRPPRIVLITSTSRTVLDESTVSTLDAFDYETVDLIARSYHWNVNGKGGIKAYLQTMFFTVREDDLERKYAVYEDG